MIILSFMSGSWSIQNNFATVVDSFWYLFTIDEGFFVKQQEGAAGVADAMACQRDLDSL